MLEPIILFVFLFVVLRTFCTMIDARLGYEIYISTESQEQLGFFPRIFSAYDPFRETARRPKIRQSGLLSWKRLFSPETGTSSTGDSFDLEGDGADFSEFGRDSTAGLLEEEIPTITRKFKRIIFVGL